jgi:hypothetical protein
MSAVTHKQFPEFYKSVEGGTELLSLYAQYQDLMATYHLVAKERMDCCCELSNFSYYRIIRLAVTVFIGFINLFGAKWEDRYTVLECRITQIDEKFKDMLDKIAGVLYEIFRMEEEFSDNLKMYIVGGKDKYEALPKLQGSQWQFAPADLSSSIMRGEFMRGEFKQPFLVFKIKCDSKPNDVRCITIFNSSTRSGINGYTKGCWAKLHPSLDDGWGSSGGAWMRSSWPGRWDIGPGWGWREEKLTPDRLKVDQVFVEQLHTLLTTGHITLNGDNGLPGEAWSLAD